MTTGRVIADQYWLTSWEKHKLAKAIDEALAEEREACAKLCRDLAESPCDTFECDAYIHAAETIERLSPSHDNGPT